MIKWGCYANIAPSFLFIKRTLEPVGIAEKTNFKPAPGVSLLFGWKARKCKFWDCLDPGIGINVSYLDFDTTKEFELGVAWLVSIFSSKPYVLQYGQGLNLHADECKEYYFIGIGFISFKF